MMIKLKETAFQLLHKLDECGYMFTHDKRFTLDGFATFIELNNRGEVVDMWRVNATTAYHYIKGFMSDPIKYELLEG